MNSSQQIFLSLLKSEEIEETLSPEQMSYMFTNAAMLSTIMNFVSEHLWLNKNVPYNDLMGPLFNKELASIKFMQDFIIDSGIDEIKSIIRIANKIESMSLSLVSECCPKMQKVFITESLSEITKHLLNTEYGRLRSLFYRTFDRLDDFFDLNYKLDQNMTIDTSTNERIFQGAGIGVQSSYSTILLALDALNPHAGSCMIDLGSGYGRVGLTCSLLRPDINFIGYEYVEHRVDVSNCASELLKLDNNLSFIAQDLSLESFKIPEADIYYLYDPFSKETYNHVLKQIVEISKRKMVKIVAKGDARKWIKDVANHNAWPLPESLDDGHLHIFSSC